MQILSCLDTDVLTIDSVRLGAMGVDSSNRGMIYFDNYESRRYSEIGLLASPGTEDPTPTSVADWINKAYSYDNTTHKHAVTRVKVMDENNNQTTNSYEYDENGNMTCCVENELTYIQSYNAENHIHGVVLTSGDCDTLTAIDQIKVWAFTYDGEGNKVEQVYSDTASGRTLTTYYYEGGGYEVQTDGATTTVKQYYTIGGVSVGLNSDGERSYFLTDHLGSIVAVTDDAGVMTSETRYTPFGEVRTDVGTIAETNYGFTNQENDSYIKLMFYKSRWYSPYLN